MKIEEQLSDDQPSCRSRTFLIFDWPYIGNGSSAPLDVWFYGRLLRVDQFKGVSQTLLRFCSVVMVMKVCEF